MKKLVIEIHNIPTEILMQIEKGGMTGFALLVATGKAHPAILEKPYIFEKCELDFSELLQFNESEALRMISDFIAACKSIEVSMITHNLNWQAKQASQN